MKNKINQKLFFLIIFSGNLSINCTSFSYKNQSIRQIQPINPIEEIHYSKPVKKPEMVLQSGHQSVIGRLAFSGDGKYLASASWDNTIRLWRVQDGLLIRVLKGHTDSIRTADFKGKYIISGSDDHYIKIWDAGTGEQVKSFKPGNYSIVDVKFSPDGQHFASIINNGKVQLWRTKDLALVKTYECDTDFNSKIAFSSDGKYLASNMRDKTIIVWDLLSGKKIRTFKGHVFYISSLVFSPDGKHLASGSWDNTIILWNIETGKVWEIGNESHAWWVIRRIFVRIPDVQCLEFTKDGRYIAAGMQDGSIKYYDVRNRKLIRSIKAYKNDVWSLAFSPDGKYLATGSYVTYDNKITLWNVLNGEKIRDFGYLHDINDMAASYDGKYIITAQKKTIKIWNKNKASITRILNIHNKNIIKIAMTSDAELGASASKDETLKIWVVKTGLVKKTMAAPKMKRRSKFTEFRTLLFSPDKKTIALLQERNTIKIWNVKTGSLISKPGGSHFAVSIAFSKDSRYLIAVLLNYKTYEIQIKYYNIKSRKLEKTIKNMKKENEFFENLQNAALIPGTSNLILVDFHNKIYIFDTIGKSLVKSFGIATRGTMDQYLKISGDGKYLANCGTNNIMIWDIANHSLFKTLKGHTDNVEKCYFTHDNEFLISLSEDNSVKMWNLKTGKNTSFVSAKNEWLIYNSDGYFDSTKDGDRLAAISKGMHVYGIDQFALKNNRPDIVLAGLQAKDNRLISHYYARYQKRLKSFKMSEDALSKELHVPVINILNKKSRGKYLSLVFSASDTKYNVTSYNIHINNVPLFGAFGKPIAANELTVKPLVIKETVELSQGDNKIEISCINEKGAESFRPITFEKYKKKEKHNLYFIGFGVSKYKDKELLLKYAHKDILDIAAVFSNMKSAYNKIVIKTYIDKDVTIKNIVNAKQFLANADVNDTFVLFIAGHGLYSLDHESRYYYLTYDADIKNLEQTAASFDLIESLLQNIAPRNKLFLMDTCESGELDDQVQKTFFNLSEVRGIIPRTSRGLLVKLKKQKRKRTYLYLKNRYIYNELLRRSGSIVFSSSRGGEFSYESDEFQNGFFTEEIINALKGAADQNNDGFVTVDELKRFVVKAVINLSKNLQHPTVDRDNIYQKFGFPVVK